mgnify:CR=1 FL=1
MDGFKNRKINIMARKPFFSGNYGSALARVDTRPIMEAGRAQGQMYANLGQQVGGMIEQYGLNKEKRAKITGEIEAYYKENPNALGEIGMSGDEAQDKKDFTEREKFVKGDMNMAQLEGYAGKLARGDVLKTKNAVRELSAAQLQSAQFLNQQRKESAGNMDNAFNALDRTRDELKGFIDSGALQPEDLTLNASRLLNNPSLLESRSPEALKYFASDPTKDAESKLKLSNLERGQKVQRGLDDSLGGAGNVGAMQGESMKETLAGQKISNERTQSLTDATRLQMELLERPVNTTIPGNQNLAKEIKSIDQEIDRLRKIETLDQDDDGKYITVEQFLEFNNVKQEYVIKEELLPNINERDLNNIDALKLSLNKVTNFRNKELVETVINRNGKQEVIYIPRQEFREKERQQKEAQEKARVENINKELEENRIRDAKTIQSMIPQGGIL